MRRELLGFKIYKNQSIILFIYLEGDGMLRGVLVIRELFLVSSTDETVSLIRRRDATRFIGTTARNGAVERPAPTVCDTRIFKFFVAGGAAGFFIMPYEVLTFWGESFSKSPTTDLRRVNVLVEFDFKRGWAIWPRNLFGFDCGDGERILDIVDGA